MLWPDTLVARQCVASGLHAAIRCDWIALCCAASSSSLSVPDVAIPLLCIQVRYFCLLGKPQMLTTSDMHNAAVEHDLPWHAATLNQRVAMAACQAEDDPIAPAHAIPYAALEANPNCTLVVTPGGGHLGWGAGPNGPLGE